ncbi:Eukaryotic peptide chain release factor GTP-binding subunit [Labeo rohita]|uniref:Eukaryotic peptide chain release factor GTP-binding subunit n=1 Tax=Labeo rohita TaxID=84645 RepID=A0ABQ8MRG4_LABRO|nr:Eukaryotic peptide chain release factor GTP-binding subunit [Labeo rohita]
MDPTVLLIILKQGERSLEDHTRDYIFLAEHSHFPDSSLCTFYRAGLNTTTKGLLSGGGSSREPAGLHRVGAGVLRTSAPLQTQNPANPHPDMRSMSPSPPRMTSQSHERQSKGSPQSQSPTRPTRCESRLRLPLRWSAAWSKRGLWRALPTAPPLGVSLN